MIIPSILGFLAVASLILRNSKKKEESVIVDKFDQLNSELSNIRHRGLARTLHSDLLEKFGLSNESRLNQKVDPNFEKILKDKIQRNLSTLESKRIEENRLRMLLASCLEKEEEIERQNIIKQKKREKEEEDNRRTAYALAAATSYDSSSSSSRSSSSDSGWGGGGGDSSGGGSSDSW